MKVNITFLFVLITSLVMGAAKVNIRGHITNNKENIPFATISVDDGKFGTSTDESGHFSLALEKGKQYTITISAVGYKTIELKYTAKNNADELHINLDKDLLQLNEVVVSSNRREQSRKETAAVVNVVNKEIFEISSSKVVADGLNFVSGVRVENNCGNCGTTALRLNGLEGPYTQILMDSRPLFNGLVSVYGLEQIPVSMVDQIEVVRGGGSVLFGANAIGGTVNIITKAPQFNSYEVGTNFGTIDGKSNDYNLYFNTSIVSKNDKTGAYVYGSYRNRDAWNANPNDVWYHLDDNEQPTGDAMKDDFSELPQLKTASVGTKVYHSFDDQNKLTADFRFIHEDRRGGNKFDKEPHETDITEWVNMNIVSGGLNYDWYSTDKKKHLNAYSNLQYVNRDSYYGADQALDGYGLTTGLTYIGGAQMNFNLGKMLNADSYLVVGTEYIYDNIHDKKLGYYDQDAGEKTNDIPISNQESQTMALFAQNEWKGNKLSVLLGARMDYVMIQDFENTDNNKNVSAFNPRLNLKYNLTKEMQIRGGIATGFRAPQMFSEDLHVEVAGGQAVRTVLDPNLKAERSLSYNFAWDMEHSFGNTQAYFLVEGFHTRIYDRFDNQFTVDVDEDGNEIFYNFKRNSTSDAIVQGVNIEAKIAPSEKFNIQGAYTFQSSRYEEDNQWGDEETSVSKEILRTPNQYGSLTLNFQPAQKWTTSLTGVYTGSMYVPLLPGGFMNGQPVENETLIKSESFFDMGAKVSYRTKLGKNANIQIGTGVKNIFNQMQSQFVSGSEKDAAFVYGPITPRMYFIEIKIGNLL
ncbi:TonB-dependent receptor [Flammeovirga yaeyamensis]|uniref:TonB-dependent receptor n=1 Tax=Flammeovirga yaeyamensis TaxID=367791 RepID=A0AAX1N0U3_9BACT|nr:TonB-dependent receptor [Flammeovirga yaeyamensis]MBB3700110.1 outer membrane receptor for ferrienterochelin and colicins [Flammeovirga yaeyamensis]NMF37259.1 TonB-dependent receptor [Flammeovirga yaeyamensis]QWG00947.1 TonB-dependent receptor [Flammeovirga yaeyamensis]